MKLYNTLDRKKETFSPITQNEVKLYTCGATVYNYAHIGNLRTYVFEDILKRTLLFNGYKVKHVMNITDVGHLTSDADEGEDKMLKGAKREKKTVWQIADFYTKAFQNDIKKLNIQDPNIWCKATDHIKEQVEMIEALEKKGFTYTAGGNVYFNTGKFKDYGKLAKLNLKAEKQARIEKDKNKKNSHDFVLWFTKSKFQDQEMKWDSKYGRGFPGWHIECSAMATKYLGKQFDIHCGGIDHIPVHHTNEIAQSEAALGVKPWVHYWLHGEFLVLNEQKMSKSSGEFLTLQKVIEKGYDPLAYRYFCLGTHYRKPLMFSWEAMDSAQNALKKLQNKVLELKEKPNEGKNNTEKYIEDFQGAINDDLNMPQALAAVWDMLKDEKVNNKNKYETLLQFDKVLGLGLDRIKKIKIPEEVQILIEKREDARLKKSWKEADQMRDKLKALGYSIEDTSSGPLIKKVQ
ncbi:cysteine--tRNA ligase [Candidatus Woesearchaeota archaeon]|nr:cysteine--tRNA ligase [Candidatus Woesearchaeota archaeon]